ncbi:MAG TPA: ASKHA domain-containing protein [Terracidiphilus sp.]|nr:ASKHA domain-containing protein [Terracidiphilus sp.]
MSADHVRIRLEPLAVEVDVPCGALLVSSLSDHGIEFPCGGTGLCGGCGVRVLAGSLPATDADRAAFPAEQLAIGWRLACQARAPERVSEPLVLECGQWHMDVLSDNTGLAGAGKHGLGVAIDLGTTTIAAQIVDLASGSVLGVETELNPQASFGSDVMNRIRAALHGDDLTTVVRTALGQIIARLARGREQEVAEVVLVGNTVMHHLFSGRDVKPLSHAPFVSPHLGVQSFEPRGLGWALPASCTIRFAHCLGGFVGSDILAGIIATGIAHSDELMALVDLGTNGEIAIGNRNGIVCASTAAGPAFEAGSIRMGMRAATGAISYVSLAGSEMKATVIGDVEPRGICGSGLVDAVAAGLKSGAILASGRVANGTKLFPVAEPVVLYQADIRELQLAKAAIASGFKLLLKRLGADASDLKSIHLAGAFGNYVQIESAIRIGLIDLGFIAAPRQLVHAAGNTALRGAKMLLLALEEPALPAIEHVSLAADPGFQDEFANCMSFPASNCV